MIYFLLPRLSFNICQYIDYTNTNNLNPYISISQSIYLNNIKNNINKNQTEWDIHKKYTNPYEYINTIIQKFLLPYLSHPLLLLN